LQHREPPDGLQTGEKNPAALERVFVLERYPGERSGVKGCIHGVVAYAFLPALKGRALGEIQVMDSLQLVVERAPDLFVLAGDVLECVHELRIELASACLDDLPLGFVDMNGVRWRCVAVIAS
jgi:hypothetical protein